MAEILIYECSPPALRRATRCERSPREGRPFGCLRVSASQQSCAVRLEDGKSSEYEGGGRE